MYIWTNRIKTKVNNMKVNVEKLDFRIKSMKVELDRIEFFWSKALLSGNAWNSVRNYTEQIILTLFRLYVSWQIEYKEAIEEMHNKAKLLPKINYMDRELFERQIIRWQRCIEREERKKHVNARRISMYISNINRNIRYIQSMEIFATSTSGIFDESKRLENIIINTQSWVSTVRFNTEAEGIIFTDIQLKKIDDLKYELYMYDLGKCGLTDKDIKEMGRLGFSLENLDDVYIEAKKYGEESLIVNLARKNFDDAFSKVPQGSGTRVFVAEYFVRLHDIDGYKEFTRALNVILKPRLDPEDPRYHMHNNTYFESNRNAREYIDILYGGTELILQRNCAALFEVNMDDKELYNELVERNAKMMGLTTLYGSIKGVIEGEHEKYKTYKGLSSPTAPQWTEWYISDLIYDKDSNEYLYTLNYKEQLVGANRSGSVLDPKMELKSIEVITHILSSGSDVLNRKTIDDCKALYKKKERLKDELALDIMASVLLEKLAPEYRLLVSFANVGYESGRGNDHTYYDQQAGANIARSIGIPDEKNIFTKWGTSAFQRSASKFLSYQEKCRQIDEKIFEKKKDTLVRLFYSGGTYSVDGEHKLVVAGIYDPGTIRGMRIAEEKGFKELVKDKYDIKDPIKEIENHINENNKSEKLTIIEKNRDNFYKRIGGSPENLGYKLWNGGCKILDEDINDFLEELEGMEVEYNTASGLNIEFDSIFTN